MGNSSSRRSVSHLDAGDIIPRQSGRVPRLRKRSTSKRSYRIKRESAATSNADVGDAISSARSSLPGRENGQSTRRQHREAAGEDVVSSGMTQGLCPTSSVSPTQRYRQRALSSSLILNMKPSPPRAVAATVTQSQHLADDRRDPRRDCAVREEAHGTSVYREGEESSGWDCARIGLSHAWLTHGDSGNVDGGVALHTDSLAGAHGVHRLPPPQRTVMSSTVLPSRTPLLALNHAPSVARGAEPALATASGQKLVAAASVMGGSEKTEDVDVDVFSAAAAPHTSSQVGHIFSPSTLTSKGDVLPGLPPLSCPPPITASLLPHLVPVGREACHSGSPRSPQMAVNTDTLQQADEDLDGGMESVANRCRRSKDKPASMFEAQSTCVSGSSDGGSGGVGGDFWSQPLGAIYRRQFSSRSDSPAKLSSLPSRPEGGEEGHTVRGDKVKSASEDDFCPREDSAMRALEGCASAAPRVHGLPPSVPSVTVSAAQDTQHTSSSARSSSLAGAAATTMAIGLTTSLSPASSRRAQRLSASQIPLAEERPAGSSAVASAVVDAQRSTSGLKRTHVAGGGLEPRVDRKECGEAPQVDMQWPEGLKCSLDVLPHAQVGRQVAGGCSSMTSTGPSSPAVLPPPPLLPSVYPSDFVWSRKRTTASNADSTNGHFDYGYENAITDDFAAAATPRLLTYQYFHPHQFRLEAPSVVGAGAIPPATVTDTTARVPSQWPFVSALPEVAAAESGDSAITTLFASFGAAADVRVKGQRSASQSAIIAVWNRMDVPTGAAASGGAALKPLAVPPTRDTQLTLATTGAAAEGEIGKGPSYRHQLAAVGDEEADHRDYSHRSRADLADALPVRHRGVGARRRKPPILFPPSPESVKLCDAAPKGISVPSSFRMQVDAPVKARSASLPASIHTAVGITASRTAMAAQEPQQKPVGRVEGEGLLRLTGGVSMSPREFPFVFDAFTMTPPRSATQWSCPKRSRGSDASTSVVYPLPERIPVPVSLHNTGSRGSVVVNTQPPLRPVMAYDDDDVSSGTATTVDAGEDDRISEGGGGAADRYIMRRGSQPLCHHQLRRRSSPNLHSLKSYTSGFTTRRTTVVATSTVTKLVLSPHTHSLCGRPRLGLIKSSSFAPNMSSEAPFEIREFAHSSPASPRSRVTAHSPLERVAATLSVEEDNIDGVDPMPTRDAGVAHRPLSQNDNELLWRLAGHDVSPFNRRFLSSPLITSRSDSLVSDATEMSTQGNSGVKGRASLQCNGYQPLRRHGQPTPAQSTSSFSPTARLMPQRQGRFILTPHSTSLLSVGASRDELGCVVGGFPSTPRSERGLNSLGILPFAQQPSMQPHRLPQPPLSTSLLRVAQSQLRHISDVWGGVRWQEVSLHASSGQASQNLDLARNSRDDDDDDGNISLRHDTLEDEEVDAVADEGNAEGGRNDDAQWRAVRLLLGSAGERTGDDSDDVFLSDERNEASMWGIEIPEKCQGGGDEDVNDGVCEEGVESNLGGNTAGRSINCDDYSVNGRCLGLPKPSHRRPSATSFLAGTLPTMAPQLLPQRSCHAANVSHDLSPFRATEEGISHSSARTRTVAETLPRFPQPRYEPPMPSNKNSFTAFVPLSAISPSQLLSTVEIVLQRAHDANLPGASPGVRDSEAAAAGGDDEGEPCAGSQVNTSVTADTLVLNGCDPKDDHLVDVANVTEGSTLLISPLYSPVSTSLTKRISRSNTRAPVALQAATVRQTLQSPVQQAAHTRSETLDTLYGSTPCTSRKATKGLPGSSHFAAAVAVSSGGGGDGSRGDAGGGGGSADLPMQVARSAVVSPQTSRSPGSASVACASFSESERHMLSEKQRPPLELLLHTPPWFRNTAAAPRASRMTVDIFGLESAQFSASQPLPGQWSRPQPWWNQCRSTAVPEASDTSDTRDHLPCSPRTTKSALPVRLGDRVASLSSPSGAAAMAAGSPAGHRMPLCGSAVATTIEAGASGGRLRLMSQYPITTTNDHRSGLARGGSSSSCSSSAKSDRGEDASLSGVVGAAVYHEPNGGVFINRMCSYDVQVRGDSECIHEKVVSGVAGIEARVALVAGRTSHDRDGDDGSQPEKSVHTPASSRWVSLSPAVPRCATTASAAEVVGANSPSETELTLSSPTQTIFTVPAVPPTAPRVEEPEGQLARDALPHALSAPSVAGEPCCNESVAPCDTEALEDGGESRKRPCVGIAIPPPRDTDTSGGNLDDTIRTALAKKPVSAALYIEEMEAYARISIEETAAGVREAWVAMWDSLNLQRQQPLLPKQSLSTTAPLPPFFPLCRRGPVKISPLGSNSSVVGGAQGGSSAGTGPGAGATLMDDCVTGVMRVNPSGSTAEAASAVLRDDTPNASNATGVTVLPLAPPFDAVVGDSTRVTGGVEVGGSGDLRDGQFAAHGDAGVEAMHEGFPPLFVERLTGSRSETAPLIALHSSVHSRGAGAALEVDHLVTSHGQPTLLRATHSPYQPDQLVTFCAANSPVSPTHASSRTPLHQHREIVGNTRTASRGQTPPTSDSGLGVSLFPPFERSTPHTRAPSRLQRQPRDSRVGRTVCRWCGKPHASAVVCPVALRPHTELRKERRMEKAAKRAAQRRTGIHAAFRVEVAMRRRGPRHWLELCQASASPSASTLKALQNARRTLHSTALQRNTSGLRAVIQLPRGMAPFQRSRTAVPPLQQRKVTESHSDGGNHAYNGLSSSTTSESVSSSCAQVADQLPPWPVDAFEFNAVVAHGGHNIRLASCTTLLSSNSDTDGVSGEGGATAPLAVATALPNGASPQHVSTAGSVPKLSLVTLNTIQQLKTVEETAEAQAALRGGGWVCTECWSIVHAGGIDNTDSATHSLNRLAPFPRTICPACRTLRHDAHTWSYIASWRLRSDLWQCTCCGERNVRATVNCRCCGTACSGGPGTGTDRNAERGSSVRMTVAVEVESCPIGHVVVTRNRTTRWRCGACKEINSLQMAVCRNCARERFAITVGCPTCDALRVLSNALVFGGEAEKYAARWPGRHMALGPFPSSSSGTTGSAHITTPSASLAAPSAFPARVFGPENCYTPNSTQITCLQCCSPLHGGPVVAVSAAAAWWCACGVVNTAAAYSCLRCRLPRFLECPEKLRALLLSAGKGGSAPSPADGTGAAPFSAATRPTWDFRSCTNWMCDSCCGVNSASYQVVAESTSSPPSTEALPGNARRGRRLWMHHGDALCRHCGAPWHHHVLPEANSWRCACHMLNPCTNTLCASCGLPALDGIRSDMLSSWSKGDWRCPSCGSLCYRDRQMCSCGTLRSKATARQ